MPSAWSAPNFNTQLRGQPREGLFLVYGKSHQFGSDYFYTHLQEVTAYQKTEKVQANPVYGEGLLL